MNRDIRSSRTAFWCGVLAPAGLGVGTWGFFLVPESAPYPLELAPGLAGPIAFYLLSSRYDFEVDQMIRDGDLITNHPRLTAFNPSTIIHIGIRGGISRSRAFAYLALATVILISSIVFAIVQILFA